MRSIAVGALLTAATVSAHAGLFTASGAGTYNGETIAFTFDYDPAWFEAQPKNVLDPNFDPWEMVYEDYREFISPRPIPIHAIGSRTGHLSLAPFTLASVTNDTIYAAWRLGPLFADGDSFGGIFTIDPDDCPAAQTSVCNGGLPHIGLGPVEDFVSMNAVFVASLNGQVQTINPVLRQEGVALMSAGGERIYLNDATWTVTRAASVPEPATWALSLLLMAVVTFVRRQRSAPGAVSPAVVQSFPLRMANPVSARIGLGAVPQGVSFNGAGTSPCDPACS